MINFDKFTLDNGLRVIVNKDTDSPIAAVNLIYNVGSKDEHPEKTGFAHLFEHLMFGGSANIPKFDRVLEEAGGKNNAFTSNDFTNYYDTLPKSNIETAFWLESDRMNALAFSDKSLEVQKNVVIEEFKERYLNRPYGDIWMLLRPLAYKVHPYQWPTIGKEISHIENADMQNVKDFFHKYYAPNNAVLSVSGNFETEYIRGLTEKWFGDIPRRKVPKRALPLEPLQTEARSLTVERDVPYDAFFKAYHIGRRNAPEFYATDFLSDILSNGESSRLSLGPVREKRLFTNLYGFHTDSIEEGLFVFAGHLTEGVSFEQAEAAIDEEIERLIKEPVSQYESEKLQNTIEANLAFAQEGVLNKAMALSSYELWDEAERINREADLYQAVTPEDIRRQAEVIFRKENASTLYYKSKR